MHTTNILEKLQETYSHQPTFLQTVEEILSSVDGYLDSSDSMAEDLQVIERLLIPERVISFKVVWSDDAGALQSNIGYRVQFNSALGPYKGGLRFDPSVNEDILKFLGFEQIFKNALTGLQLGGGKGGSDFNPKGRSDNEIRSFCRAFMLELHRHIGIDRDVPAGDIGVGAREIGYLYGMYKQITNSNEGALTGKDELFGGSCQRTEATGHGVVYFAQAVAKQHDIELADMKAVVSGAGNVAEYTARKLIEIGATVLTLSDRDGYLYKADGFTQKDIDAIKACKQNKNNLDTLDIEGAEYKSGKPWQSVEADAYFPCATQNELDQDDAQAIIKHGKLLIEGANMPLTEKAVQVIRQSDVVYAPGKAANAGGVTVSGIEMAQNAGHYAWKCEEIEAELQKIMIHIHDQCVAAGKTETGVDYVLGANVAGFKRVLDATKKLGW
jgi:glutamate dehydrogenase (NADP+)